MRNHFLQVYEKSRSIPAANKRSLYDY